MTRKKIIKKVPISQLLVSQGRLYSIGLLMNGLLLDTVSEQDAAMAETPTIRHLPQEDEWAGSFVSHGNKGLHSKQLTAPQWPHLVAQPLWRDGYFGINLKGEGGEEREGG